MNPDVNEIESVNNNSGTKKFLAWLKRFFLAFLTRRDSINRWMSHKLSSVQMSLIVTFLSFILQIIMLFIPNYLGLGNDGSVTATMRDAGLSYAESDSSNANSYFTRVYQIGYSDYNDNSFYITLLNLAKGIDEFFTNDNLFDIRFLALIYVILFAPAIFLLTKSALDRISEFTERLVISILALVVFTDISYISYFNSLYPDALFFIGIIYIFSSAMSLQKEEDLSLIYWIILTLWSVVLCLTKQHCFFIGFVMAAFVLINIRIVKKKLSKIMTIISAIIMILAGFISIFTIEDNFDSISKIHSMTRGVLLQSTEPVEALQEFSINGSYSMLTDISLYDKFPLLEDDDLVLENGFLDKYDSVSVGLYYLRHPGSILSMWDLGIKSAFDLRRSFCGNYERSVGMPAMSKSLFWSAASTFKSRSAPKTIGYILVLIIAYILLAGKRMFRGKTIDKSYFVYFQTMVAITLVGMLHISYIIIRSGDAQLVQYNLILGLCIDLLSFYVLAELLHRLNIFEEKGRKNG